MRWNILLGAVLVFAQASGAAAQLTGAPSEDARMLNFQMFERIHRAPFSPPAVAASGAAAVSNIPANNA